MGVFLDLSAAIANSSSLPHARGGVSYTSVSAHSQELSSPRPWGCFCVRRSSANNRFVFPTPVGVFLDSSITLLSNTRLPHARGGVSMRDYVLFGIGVSSPRPWGCFLMGKPEISSTEVFPTPVGVFPLQKNRRTQFRGLPHARGGVSHIS